MARDSKKSEGARIPPQSVDAEMSVLGSLMLDKEAVFRIADALHPTDFYKNAHQTIFQAMLDLFNKGEPIDMVSVSSKLKEKKLIEKIAPAFKERKGGYTRVIKVGQRESDSAKVAIIELVK